MTDIARSLTLVDSLAVEVRDRLVGCLSPRVSGLPAGGQQRRELLGHAEHRIVPSVELVPFAIEPLGGTALVRLPRIDGAAAPDHRRRPLLVPEAVELDRALVDPDRMQRITLQRPGARRRVEIGEQPSLRVFSRGAGGKPAGDGGRAPDDVANSL